jgi:uncharacterized protein
MAFRAPRRVTARWRRVDGDGLEHLSLKPEAGRIVADSVLIGGRGGVPYGARYRIICDAGWVVVSLDLESTDGRALHIRSSGSGTWQDASGRPMPDLDGCIDVDLAGSPFTNTLPIRRLGLGPEDDTVEMKMLYVPFDTFTPTVDGQIYRCLETDRLYRYEAADRSFTADITVDDDGLVVDYPTLFKRIEAST